MRHDSSQQMLRCPNDHAMSVIDRLQLSSASCESFGAIGVVPRVEGTAGRSGVSYLSVQQPPVRSTTVMEIRVFVLSLAGGRIRR